MVCKKNYGFLLWSPILVAPIFKIEKQFFFLGMRSQLLFRIRFYLKSPGILFSLFRLDYLKVILHSFSLFERHLSGQIAYKIFALSLICQTFKGIWGY